MPVINSITDQFVKKEEGFLDKEIHERAFKDFDTLLAKSQFGRTINLKHISLSNATNSYIADCAVLGATTKEPLLVFPKNIIHREDKAYIAVVLYNEDSVEDVFMFPVSELRKKQGLFSIYKDLKKEDCYAIKMSKYKKFSNYKFGIVLKDYIN